MFPMRFFLVNTGGFHFVWKMSVVKYNDGLQLQVTYHQPIAPINQSIVDAMQTNESSEDFFKTLPFQTTWRHILSLNECERVLITLSEILNSYPNNYPNSIRVVFPWPLDIHMYWSHWYAMYSFAKQFVDNYYTWVEQLRSQPNEQQHHQLTEHMIQIEDDDVSQQYDEAQEEDYEVIMNADTLTLMNDCLKIVPNNTVRYYLTKYIHNFTRGMHSEREYAIVNTDQNIAITIAPVLDAQLISLSKRHYKELMVMINSFNPLPDESLSILRQLVNQLVFMLGNMKDEEAMHLPLKLTEFLIFIYSIKHYQLDFLTQIPEDNPNPLAFHNLMTNMVNYYVHHILEGLDREKRLFNSIMFIHAQDAHFEKEIGSIDELDAIIAKERYMLDIDRQKFIDLVYEQAVVKTKASKANKKAKLILQNPTIIRVADFIDKNPMPTAWMYYHTIPSPPTLANHTIITNEYLQLLKLVTATDVTSHLIYQELSTMLTRYADIILNVIFKQINNTLDKTSMISSLTLLQEYIRPNIPENATLITQMHILYRCVIPYLYDIYDVQEFQDHFH